MAGRGRGKSSMSFSMEQLGFAKGEMLPAPLLQPSPSYPMLDHKPSPIQITTEISYLVELKRDFTEYMRESSNNVQAVVLNEDIERFCEDYEERGYNRLEYESKYDWSRLPMELKSSRKRKLEQSHNVRSCKKRKIVDIDKKLMELEKSENTQRDDVEEEAEDEDEDEEEKEREVDEEEIDEEMDDGTDYANEYFETGENYCSEDDNDDGPVF